jgi:hypothetical protein
VSGSAADRSGDGSDFDGGGRVRGGRGGSNGGRVAGHGEGRSDAWIVEQRSRGHSHSTYGERNTRGTKQRMWLYIDMYVYDVSSHVMAETCVCIGRVHHVPFFAVHLYRCKTLRVLAILERRGFRARRCVRNAISLTRDDISDRDAYSDPILIGYLPHEQIESVAGTIEKTLLRGLSWLAYARTAGKPAVQIGVSMNPSASKS